MATLTQNGITKQVSVILATSPTEFAVGDGQQTYKIKLANLTLNNSKTALQALGKLWRILTDHKSLDITIIKTFNDKLYATATANNLPIHLHLQPYMQQH